MKKLFAVSSCLGCLVAVSTSHAADLKQSKFTQVVNDVRVISSANNLEKPAVVNAVFNLPDLVRTGVASRAELVADDKTITRVGANTVFSFDPANRTIDLQQGSLLFHSPKGKGGGTIRTGSATASVLGTTIIVTTTPDGGFKVIDLEGHVAIQYPNGVRQELSPGQMTFILPGGNPSPIITISLDDLTSKSLLVQGFDQPLPSWPLILQEIANQVKLIQSGGAEDIGLLVGDYATRTTVQVVDPNTIEGNQSSDENQTNQTTGRTTTGGGGTAGGAPTAVVISSPTLDAQYVKSSISAGTSTFPEGFLAPSSTPNITINTPTIDLSPYANQAEFAFVAPSTLTISGSVNFTGFPSTATLDLYANQFSFASGATVEADVGLFNLEPQAATTLSNVTILDNVKNSVNNKSYGEVNIFSPATLSFSGSTVKGSFVVINGTTGVNDSGSTFTATFGNLSIIDGGGINLSGSTISATQGLTFGDTSSGDVTISATGGTVTITGGTTISAASLVKISSDTGVSITGASTVTSGGFLEILADTTSSDTISVTGNSTLNAGPSSNVILQSGGDLTVNGATINADPATGSVFMDSASGLITVKNASITTADLTLNSGDGILLDGTGGTLTLNGGGSGTANLTAAGASGGSLTVTGSGVGGHPNVDFSSFSTVNMTAHTINLANVAFANGSAVNLASHIAQLALNPNTGAVSVPGEVNFITGVTYGGSPAQNFVPTAQGGNYAPSTFPAPIQITAGPY